MYATGAVASHDMGREGVVPPGVDLLSNSIVGLVRLQAVEERFRPPKVVVRRVVSWLEEAGETRLYSGEGGASH